ncbi:hypothetical protein [Sphingomonas arenae]|uniref:hypothetical protein n=1 Tax=Sphingomonas arenae TaxID=2812555 RepID=UPI0019688A22|nr:hypothetical protein [Sphingomonas arenae]
MSRPARVLLVGLAGLLLLGLVGRILTYPLQADEQFYLPPALLLDRYELYRDLGFTHLPNLPLLLAALVQITGSADVLMIGRLVVLASWAAVLAILYRTGRAEGAGLLAIAAATGFVLLDTNLLGEAGIAATNNFVPVPFAVGGVACFLAATRHKTRAPLLAASSGLLLALAAGFKANYAPFIVPVALAAMIVPPEWSLRDRLVRLAAPMLVGGVLGGLPTLLYLAADPAGVLASVFHAHRGPQVAYWLANPDPADPKVMGMAGKLILARELWLGGSALLMLLATAVLLLLIKEQEGGWRQAVRRAGWKSGLMAVLIGTAAIVSFLPTPAFPQYYVLPLPFGALLLLVLHGRLAPPQRVQARPVLAAALALAVVNGAPSLLPSAAGIVQPSQWASSKLRNDGRQLADVMQAAGAAGRVATLEPLTPLVVRNNIYPELALGPFVYRAADWIEPKHRRQYRHIASPTTIGAVLGARPPAAVLVGGQGKLDDALADFARRNGYLPQEISVRSGGKVRTRTLYLPPASARGR